MIVGSGKIEAAFSGKLGDFTLDVTIDAPLQGIIALFGPSGCGKTTILRCMAGLQHLPGSMKVGQHVWQNDERGIFLKPYRRAVGYVFQEPSLFPHLSVQKNMQYGAQRVLGKATGWILDFGDVVDMLGLSLLLDRMPDSLSGGEKQRVAVGRALLSQPELLLMDEPLVALDYGTKEEILPYLEALHDNLSIPIIYVSHDIAEVARLADRIVVLENGKIVVEGDVASVLERLDLKDFADYSEAGVLLTARVIRHDNFFQLTYLDYRGQSFVTPLVKLNVGDEVRLRLRSRDVTLATKMPTGISVRNILKGFISEIREENNTAYSEIFVDISGSIIRSRITRAAVADLALHVGIPIYVLVKSVTFERVTRLDYK
ncbi:MAG: molybdenum ABC transporter ATP-binding protein [Candidatus Marinimicrobia bacterium]|nr:molybdenum ABC transporter ATP-binding protein [Candidatus Neomarinimicrobiota bacterium]